MKDETIFSKIDHAILKPYLSEIEIIKNLNDIIDFHYHTTPIASVCVMPSYVKLSRTIIQEKTRNFATMTKDLYVSVVAGFPHGSSTLHTKLEEIEESLNYDAKEIDMVVDISNVTSNKWKAVSHEITAVYSLVKSYKPDRILKVIFENCYLNEHQKLTLCDICSEIMEDGFVKTSTGFGPTGATVSDVEIMRQRTSPKLGIKASGGIKTIQELHKLYDAGATRFGCSNTIALWQSSHPVIDNPLF